jgi:hypothetical protein
LGQQSLDRNEFFVSLCGAVNTMHWFSSATAAELFADILQSFQSGRVFLLIDSAGAEPPFAPGFDAWQKEQPSQHKYEDWRRFWSRVNALLELRLWLPRRA